MNLEDLRVFCAVASHQSFITAAKHLNMATATVSRRIAALEQSLDQLLIHRSTRSVELSEAGESLLSRAGPLMDEFESIKQETGSDQSQARGKLRLQIPQELFADNFIDCLQGFLAEYPEIDVHCRQYLGWSHQAPEGFDLTLICYEVSLPDSDWIAVPLLSLNQAIFASPTLLQQISVSSWTPDVLADQAIISRCDESHWYFRRGNQIDTIAINSRLKLDSLSQQIKAATKGMGLIKAPINSVTEQLKNGTLVAVPMSTNPAALSVSLYYRSRVQPMRVKLFMDYLQRYLAS